MRDEHGWIQSYTGKKVWPLDPLPEDICIEDIAHALANVCRYGGHCIAHYSVAQHSVIMYWQARREPGATPFDWAHVLLHDAAEAYLPDIPRPTKRELEKLCPQLRVIEGNLQKTILRALEIRTPAPHNLIKHWDMVLLATERRDLMKGGPLHWRGLDLDIKPLEWDIHPWSPTKAENEFLRCWEECSAAIVRVMRK